MQKHGLQPPYRFQQVEAPLGKGHALLFTSAKALGEEPGGYERDDKGAGDAEERDCDLHPRGA